MLRKLLCSVFLVLIALPAWAGGIAVVDFQRAVTETEEGKSAQKKIDAMYLSRKTEIERLKTDLDSKIKDYQARALILSEEARSQEEQKLGGQQQQFEQTYMQYQQEVQQTYMTLLQDLDEKMRTIAQALAKEKGYSVVLDSAAIVYHGADVADMTDPLVQRYNSTYTQ